MDFCCCRPTVVSLILFWSFLLFCLPKSLKPSCSPICFQIHSTAGPQALAHVQMWFMNLGMKMTSGQFEWRSKVCLFWTTPVWLWSTVYLNPCSCASWNIHNFDCFPRECSKHIFYFLQMVVIVWSSVWSTCRLRTEGAVAVWASAWGVLHREDLVPL